MLENPAGMLIFVLNLTNSFWIYAENQKFRHSQELGDSFLVL